MAWKGLSEKRQQERVAKVRARALALHEEFGVQIWVVNDREPVSIHDLSDEELFALVQRLRRLKP